MEGGGSMFNERTARPATYDGEDVSPDAWAKVRVWFVFGTTAIACSA